MKGTVNDCGSELLSPFTINLQQQQWHKRRNCIISTVVARSRIPGNNYSPLYHRLAQNIITIATSLIHPLLLLMVVVGSTEESVCAAVTDSSSLPVIEKEGRTAVAVVGVDKIAPPVSLKNDNMLGDESIMDYPFHNIFSEEKGQCIPREEQQQYYFGGGNNNKNAQSILSNHDYSTTAVDNKIITRMDVQAPLSSLLEEEYLISSSTKEESNVICVNCHALFQIQVMIHGEKSVSSTSLSTNDLLGNDQWYISLQEVGHNGGVMKSIYDRNYALDLSCEQHASRGDYCHDGTSSPTLDTPCHNAVVQPFTCRSVARLLVPYSSLLDGLDLDYSTHHNNAYHPEVVILASLTRESKNATSSYYSSSSSSRRVVDRWLVNVAIPTTMRRGIGGDKRSLDGRLKSKNPIYTVKLKDRVHVNTGEEESSIKDAIRYSSTSDWYVKCGVSVSGAVLAAIVVLAVISKFITNGNDHVVVEDEDEEEEVDYEESTPIYNSSDQREEIIVEDEEEEQVPHSGQVIILGEIHSRYSPTVTGMGGTVLFQGDGGDAQEREDSDNETARSADRETNSPFQGGVNVQDDDQDDRTAHSDRKTNTNQILNHVGQNDVRTSSQDVMSHSDDNSSPVHSNVLNVETNENNNTSGYRESVSNADHDNSPNTNVETNADAAMHLEIYSPQYHPEEESAPLPHSNTSSMEEKSDQQVPEQTDADNSSNTAMHLEIYSPQSEEEIAHLPHSNTLSMEEKSEQQNEHIDSGKNGTSSCRENQSDISNDASKSGNAANLLCDVDGNLQEEENDELGREANGSISSNTAEDKASSNDVVLEEKSAREQSLAESELHHENGKANYSPEINLLDTSVSSPEDECDLQCLHFSGSKGEEEFFQSIEKYIPKDVSAAHECEDINVNKATAGTAAEIETRDAEHSFDANVESSSDNIPNDAKELDNNSKRTTNKSVALESPPKIVRQSMELKEVQENAKQSQPSPSDGINPSVSSSALTERVQNVNNNKTSPSEEISSKCSFPITHRNTDNKRRKASKSVVLSSHQLANSKIEEEECSIGRKYYHQSAVAREIQHLNEIDAMQDAQVAHAATAAYGEGADDVEASGLDTDDDEDDGDTKRNPYIDDMANEDDYKRTLHEEESEESSSASSNHQVNKENLPSPVVSSKQNDIIEDSFEQNDENIDFSGDCDDSSPDRTPLSSRLSTNNMALFMHQNSSPSSTVAATVHDERTTSRKPQTKAKDEIREKPLSVRSGGVGQSKRFGVSPAPSIFPSLSQSNNEQHQHTLADNVDYGATDCFENDPQQNQWNDEDEDRPRKRSRSKKEKRKIRKKLMATTRSKAVHKPSSSLRPLSQMMEEPVWQSNAEVSAGRVSSEMSY